MNASNVLPAALIISFSYVKNKVHISLILVLMKSATKLTLNLQGARCEPMYSSKQNGLQD